MTLHNVKYHPNRYPPPHGPYVDEKVISRRLYMVTKSLEAKSGSWDPIITCAHCWNPRHQNQPLDCDGVCGICDKNHPAPCPAAYCTTDWWATTYGIPPPDFVQIKPNKIEQGKLVEAGILVKIATRTGESLAWNISPLHDDPLGTIQVREEVYEEAVEEAPPRDELLIETLFESHDSGIDTAIRNLSGTCGMSEAEQKDVMHSLYLSKKKQALFPKHFDY